MVYLKKQGQIVPIEPKLSDGVIELIELSSFTYSKRIEGNEEITFNAQNSRNLDDFEEGKTYFVYADQELTKLLPCTFTLQNRLLKFDGGEDFPEMRKYEIRAISIDEKLQRKKISLIYRNIRFKNLLIKAIEQYRKFVPDISNDYSYIEDVDFSFVVFKKKNLFLSEIFEILRGLGYQCFLRPDFKVQAGLKSYLPNFSIDLNNDTIGTQFVGIQRNDSSSIVKKYKDMPITSVVCKAGFSESGTIIARNAITNKESSYDLQYKVSADDNFFLEPFNSDVLDDFDFSLQSDLGWFKRYAVYNSPVKLNIYQLWETSIQILEHKEAYFLGINDGNRLEAQYQAAAFYFEGANLYVTANGVNYPTGKVLKKFLSLNVTAVSGDFLNVTLDSIGDLVVGDTVQVTGINTGIELALGKVQAINGLIVTLDRATFAGDWNNSIKLTRITTYELRIQINSNGVTEFYVRDQSYGFDLVGTYNISYPTSSFITAFNCYEEPIQSVDNGVWEVGGYSIDYFFVDRALYIKAYDDTGKKIVLSTQNQAEVVGVEGIVNSVSKNGKDLGQVQFIAPTYVKLVLNNLAIPPTTTKFPVAFAKEDSLQIGMRILVNNEASIITDFFQDVAQGYIECSPALSAPPVPLTQVWINTSIPADNTNFFIEYIPSKEILIRDEADITALSKWGIREQDISLTEYTDVGDLADRLKLFIDEEISPTISGNISFPVNFRTDNIDYHFNTSTLPTVGEYIQVTESIQGINSETAMIQAYTLQAIDDEGIFNLALELGEFTKSEIFNSLKRLERKVGIIQDSDSEMNYNLPSIKRESMRASEISFNRNSAAGQPFVSGYYLQNYSGGGGATFNITEISFVRTSATGYPFVSGRYVQHYSGNLG